MNKNLEFTREQFIEAIGKDGYTQGKRGLFIIDREGNFRACALGQGLINLGVVDYNEDIVPALEKLSKEGFYGPFYPKDDDNPMRDLYDVIAEKCGSDFPGFIYNLNDEQGLSCEVIALKAKEYYGEGEV